jgi:anti-anti-sigma factor
VVRRRIEVSTVSGVVVLALHGDHDVFAVDGIRFALDQQLQPGSRLIVDLGSTSFIDSSVLRELVRAQDRARSQGATIRFVLPEDAGHIARRLIEVAHFHEYLAIDADLDAALRYVTTASSAEDR